MHLCEMPSFPVLQSTLSPSHLAHWIATQYGWDQVRCQVLKTTMNHTYRVQAAEQKAVLRVYAHAHRSELEISEELRVLQLLHEAGLAVSYPIATSDGRLVQLLPAPEGPRAAVLFSFAEGAKLRFLSPELSRQIGVLMGKFHQIGSGRSLRRISYTSQVLVDRAIQALQDRFPESIAELEYMRACTVPIAGMFDARTALQQGIVHLDLWYDNMSIDAQGQICLFDFDNLGNGPLVLDLGYYCMQLFFIEADKADYERKKAAFLEGYQSVMAVSDAELQWIPYAGLAIWLHYLGLQAERFDYSGNLFVSANYIKMYLGRAKEWLAYNGVTVT